MKTGLVLEGGSVRGLYTVGVLDCLLDHRLYFPYVIGVSAGAGNGVSYVTRQRGRSYRVDTAYLKDKRYLSFSNYRKTKSVFGMGFIFDEIPNRLDPLDYQALRNSDCEFLVGVTDAETGLPVYFGKEKLDNQCTVLSASSSMPVFSPPVFFEGRAYLDGGTTDPIPVKKALADGCERLVVVLTRDRTFIKPPEKGRLIYRRVLKKYPNMIRALDERHIVYNETLDFLRVLEQEGTAIVIAPKKPLPVGRFERNLEHLNTAYQMGMQDASKNLEQIANFLA